MTEFGREYFKIKPRRSINGEFSDISSLCLNKESLDESSQGREFGNNESSSQSLIKKVNKRKASGFHKNPRIQCDRASSTKTDSLQKANLQNGILKSTLLNDLTHSTKKQDAAGFDRILVYLLYALILLTPIVWCFSTSVNQTPIRTCTFENLYKQEPIQNGVVWQILSAGIESMLDTFTDKPTIYLFLHQGGSEIRALIKEIANRSSTCFEADTLPIELTIEAFTSTRALDDYGTIIEMFKSNVKKKKRHVVLIANLNEIPAEAARALHAICDLNNPIYKDLVIFLTLTTSNVSDNPVNMATDTLQNLWGQKLSRSELEPLITRITDQVIALES